MSAINEPLRGDLSPTPWHLERVTQVIGGTHVFAAAIYADPVLANRRLCVMESGSERDAALMAAAPGLLSVCRALQQTMIDGRLRDDDEVWKRLLLMVTAVIGQAEGGDVTVTENEVTVTRRGSAGGKGGDANG